MLATVQVVFQKPTLFKHKMEKSSKDFWKFFILDMVSAAEAQLQHKPLAATAGARLAGGTRSSVNEEHSLKASIRLFLSVLVLLLTLLNIKAFYGVQETKHQVASIMQQQCTFEEEASRNMQTLVRLTAEVKRSQLLMKELVSQMEKLMIDDEVEADGGNSNANEEQDRR